MAVNDQLVATLRAHLQGKAEEHSRLFEQIDINAQGLAWSTLVAGGFFEAVDRRWGKKKDVADIVDYVAHLRAVSPELAEAVDPKLAEHLILYYLGEGAVPDVDGNERLTTQLILLTALVVDEQLDDSGMDAFLADARATADQWLK